MIEITRTDRSELLSCMIKEVMPKCVLRKDSVVSDDANTAPVTYVPGFLADPQMVFDRLWNELSFEKREDAPRMEFWTNIFGQNYSYGRGAGLRTYSSQPTHELIEAVKTALATVVGFSYEGCFLNGYRGERDALGWHADDDSGIDHSKPIAVVTVGCGRAIQFKPIVGGPSQEVFLEPGSLLLMHAGMQSTHYHRIPKVGKAVGPRISLTFRSLFAPEGFGNAV